MHPPTQSHQGPSPETDARRPAGLLLTSDLMFASKVAAAARRMHVHVTVRRADDGGEESPSDAFALVMVDLVHLRPALIPGLIGRLKQSSPAPHVVAYGPHVDNATLEQARRAGCDEVLTRGQFHQQMELLLDRWLVAR